MASEEGDRAEQNVPHTSVIEIVSKSGRPVTGFFSSNILPAQSTNDPKLGLRSVPMGRFEGAWHTVICSASAKHARKRQCHRVRQSVAG